MMSDVEESLDAIFERSLSGRRIVKDSSVLRSDYVPSRLPFREKQIMAIGQVLAPLLKNCKTSNLLLYGKTGTGKTVVTRYVINKLAEHASRNNLNICFAYSNTRVAGTSYRVLSELASAISLNIPFTGLALGEVLQRVATRIASDQLLVVFVLDEIDFIVKTYGDNLLYELTRCNEQLNPGFLSLIGISNDLRFKEFLDPRVISSLSEEEIVFPPYTAEEIKAILQQRAEDAFYEDAVAPSAINLCAALAGSEHGDARRAVDLLRVAAEVAEREGARQLEERHVRVAVQKIERDRMFDALNSLPLQAKVLLLSILTCRSPSSTGEVYSRYRELCRKAGIEILTQRRVSGLLSELDLLGLVVANTVSHGRYGRTKKISCSVPMQMVREVFANDPMLSMLI